jgi:hypothetical protein
MKHEEEPVNDYNERMKEYITDLVKQEIVGLGEEKKRDYKKEYAKYGSSTKSKKYRAELNQYNRKKGTYGNGDGKDASHKGGKIVGFEKESTNRGRAEKSRLKKENIPSPSRSTVKKMKKKGNTSVPYGSGYKKVNEFKEMSIKDAFKDLVKSQGKKKALDTLTSVLSGGVDMTPDVKKKFQKKLLKKLSESNFMEYKLKMPVNEVLSKDFFNSYKVTTRNVQKAIQIAKNMKGNMTLAVKKIEKIKKGLSDDSQVMDALRQYNESVDESKELKSKKEGVYEKNKGKTLYGKDLVNYFVKRFKYSTRDATAVANKLKDVGFKVPKVLPFNESINESGILYKAGVKKYGKEGMAKILSAAGKKKSHAEIGAIKDKYEKDKKESVNEAPDYDLDGMKKFIDNSLKRAGIKVLKFNPMQKSKIGNNIWGGFYTVKSNHIGQMGAPQKSDVLPFYIDKQGKIDLGVSSKKFIIGIVGDESKVIKNLKSFKKSDLGESYKTLTEGIKARMGEIAKQGEWEVYDPQTDKTIKVVKNSGAATRLMNRLMNSGQYEEIASRHVETHKKKFENISVTEKKGVSGSVFTIDTAKKTTELMTKVLKKVSPDIQSGQIYHSSLGGADRVSIVGKFSLDPKKTWSNNILENSRFVTFYLENDGTLEVNVNGYPSSMRGKVKMRKSANNDIKQVLSRMVTHFSMLNKKYPEGN